MYKLGRRYRDPKLFFFLFITVSVLLQATSLNYLRLFSVKPQLPIIGVVLSSLYLPAGWALSLALFAGILKDIFSIQYWGVNTFLCPALSFTIISLSRKISLDDLSVRACLICLSLITVNIAARIIFIILGQQTVSAGAFLRITFLESLYSSVIFLPLFKLIKPVIEG